MSSTRRRRILLISLTLIAASAATFFVVRPSRHSATVEINLAKSESITRALRDSPNPTQPLALPLGYSNCLDDFLLKAIESDEFRELPLSKKFPDDDVKHTAAVAALRGMCVCFGRADPRAIRITVSAASTREAETIAELIGKHAHRSLAAGMQNSISERRDREHREAEALRIRVQDLERSVSYLRQNLPPETNTDPASIISSEWVAALARGESDRFELETVRARLAEQQRVTRRFADLSLSAADAATFWLVPAAALGDSGWTRLPEIPDADAVVWLTDPAMGRDWLSASLSTSGPILDYALGLPEIRDTRWINTFRAPAPKGESSGKLDTDAAKRDLAERVTLAPIGDGDLIAMGLSGSIKPTERYTILRCLLRSIDSVGRQELSVKSVREREELDRDIDELNAQLVARQDEIRLQISPESATAAAVRATFESSEAGQDAKRLIEARIDLEAQQRRLEARTSDGVGRKAVVSRYPKEP